MTDISEELDKIIAEIPPATFERMAENRARRLKLLRSGLRWDLEVVEAKNPDDGLIIRYVDTGETVAQIQIWEGDKCL